VFGRVGRNLRLVFYFLLGLRRGVLLLMSQYRTAGITG
jgi:hypothetical protein